MSTRTKALTVAAPAPGVTLTSPQKKLLAEALRRAEETRDVMEDALVGFGRWVLVTVFDDDASAALDERADNPVWRELLARAGGPTLRLNRKLLYVSVHIAARDKRITDEAWRALEPGRKELLLPLGDDKLLRKAAQHVTAMKLTQRDTRAYVDGLREEQGHAPKARLTAPRLMGQVKRMRAAAGTAAAQRRAAAVVRAMSDAQKQALGEELDAIAAWLAEMRRSAR
jgi:hypothetical protein